MTYRGWTITTEHDDAGERVYIGRTLGDVIDDCATVQDLRAEIDALEDAREAFNRGPFSA